MKKQRWAVGLLLFAGVLAIITGLRDIFAPGFFNISPRIPTRSDIIIQFSLAAMFFLVAASIAASHKAIRTNKK